MTQTIEHPQSEREKVESWRLHVLIEAGYPLSLAEKIAHSEADLHRAVELVLGLLARDGRRDPALAEHARARLKPGTGLRSSIVKVEATEIEGRKVYSVRAFNTGVARYLQKLPTIWVEGEVTELRR